MRDDTDIHPALLKHWRGSLNVNYSWPRSMYHSVMYSILEPFLKGSRQMDGLKMKYFVLKPRGGDAYAKASRAAMEAYAKVIDDENPVLAQQLKMWATDEKIVANSEARQAVNG